MTAVDTNVLVRIVVNDHPAQSARAAEFLRQQDRVFLAKTVLLEVEWILRSAYRLGRREILAILRGILAIGSAEVEDEAAVVQAMRWYEEGMDFADALHMASAGTQRFVTFDRALQERARRLGIAKIALL
jgi:predicted nucleic-acid-binding protein